MKRTFFHPFGTLDSLKESNQLRHPTDEDFSSRGAFSKFDLRTVLIQNVGEEKQESS